MAALASCLALPCKPKALSFTACNSKRCDGILPHRYQHAKTLAFSASLSSISFPIGGASVRALVNSKPLRRSVVCDAAPTKKPDSAAKRARQAEKRRIYNKAKKSEVKTRMRKLVLEVINKLKNEYSNLPVGKNGRDDENMILWYLKDRKFVVEETVTKLIKSIKWREDFGVSSLSEDSLKGIYESGKAYVHDFADINGRPVLVVVASKHFPEKQEPLEDQKLCVFLIEKALQKLSEESGEILVIVDLRGFSTANADIMFFKFLIDAFYYYYPKRLGQVLLVDAPFLFQPMWQLLKPLLKSYASLVRFCDVGTLTEYFNEDTMPASFGG